MDTSRCAHCGRPIFFGPASPTRIRTQYEKYFDGWMNVVWRHVDTDEEACRITRAEPIMDRGEIIEGEHPTFEEVHNELAQGAPEHHG